MIFKDQHDRVHIAFGSGDIAAQIGTVQGENTLVLALQSLDEAVGTGNNTNEKFDYGKCLVVLRFDSAKSIDVVMGWLEQAKERYAKEYGEASEVLQ